MLLVSTSTIRASAAFTRYEKLMRAVPRQGSQAGPGCVLMLVRGGGAAGRRGAL